MDTLLEAIDVCDVDGFCYGNYTDEEAGTGCTVIVAPEGATGGVDVRGGAPASRETRPAATREHRRQGPRRLPFGWIGLWPRGCKRRRSRA